MTDHRRHLFAHLMDCRNCTAESLIFCDAVREEGRQYREMVEHDGETHRVFIDTVIKGRLRRIQA